MRSLMPKKFEPRLIVNDVHDKFIEVELTVNEHFVASMVFDGGLTDSYEYLVDWWKAQIMRRC